jgi:hypothetical protein
MDGGQNGPPRREVWSRYHPSSKTILAFKAPRNVSFLPTRKCQPATQFIDNLKLSPLTRSSRFFQRRRVLL